MREPVRVPPHAAAGVDDELTARPRTRSDELGFEHGSGAGLSLEPEDIGGRWLSEATEQGEAVPHSRLDFERSLMAGPDTDAARIPSNFEHENSVWQQMVELMSESKGAADPLRRPAALEDEWGLSAREVSEEEARDRSATDADVREFSLLDRVNEAGDDTIAPDLATEEAGRHAQTTSRHAYGAQFEEQPDRERAPATVTEAPGRRHSADR